MELVPYTAMLTACFIIVFSLETQPGTAGNADFTGISRSVTFQPGQASASVEIDITDDTIVEPTETFQVAMKDPSYTVQMGQPTTVNIIDDDGNTCVFFPYFTVCSDYQVS